MSDPAVSAGRAMFEPRNLSKSVGLALILRVSFVVLVSEIVATRMVAPYVGVTLESLSAVIGCVLAGISLGKAAKPRLGCSACR